MLRTKELYDARKTKCQPIGTYHYKKYWIKPNLENKVPEMFSSEEEFLGYALTKVSSSLLEERLEIIKMNKAEIKLMRAIYGI